MAKCIYCLATEDSETFKKQEHIIPRTIGGQRKLPLGFCCDSCNASFSVIEKRFVQDSYISLAKMLIGPSGRSGKFQTNLHVMTNSFDGSIALGYTEQGAIPHIVEQFRLNKKNQCVYIAEAFTAPRHAAIIQAIKNSPNESIIRKTFDELDLESVYLTIYKRKVFCFSNPQTPENDVELLISNFQIGQIDLQMETLEERKSQVSAHQSLSFNIDDFNRVICKIGFNLLAFYHPEEIFDNRFDALRNYIRFNRKTENEFCQIFENVVQLHTNLKTEFRIEQESHVVQLVDLGGRKDIVAVISLYKNMGYVVMSGCDEKIIDLRHQRMFVNEYTNKREYEYMESRIKELKKLNREVRSV